MAIAPGRSSGGAASPNALEMNVRPPAANAATENSAVLTASEGRDAPKSTVVTASAMARPTRSRAASRWTKRRKAKLPATYAPAPIASTAPVSSVDVPYDSTKREPA